MIYTKEDRPLRLQSDKLIVEELPDELMIYDPARNKAFCLNQTAALVWRHADGETTVAEMAVLMGQHLDQPVNEQAVWYALDILSKDGLLAQGTVLPEVSAGVTRRALLQRLGVGAAAAVPLVTVLLVSPAKAHASSLPKEWDDDGGASNHPPYQHQSGNGGSGSIWDWLNNWL